MWGFVFKFFRMKIEFDIYEEKVACFSGPAKEELRTKICDIANNLVDEACRVESKGLFKGKTPEVSCAMVVQAANIFLKDYNFLKRNKWKFFLDIISFFSTSGSSVLFTIAFSDVANNLQFLIIAILLFGIGSVTTGINIYDKCNIKL